jgi:hypothetical protein
MFIVNIERALEKQDISAGGDTFFIYSFINFHLPILNHFIE